MCRFRTFGIGHCFLMGFVWEICGVIISESVATEF